MRWSEEIILLREEMRRVLAFLTWHADWWDTQSRLSTENCLREQAEGYLAYAKKQAHIRRSIRASFKHVWQDAVKLMSTGVGADNEILDLGLATSADIMEPPSLEVHATPI